MADMLALNCLVMGDDVRRIFPVDISNTATVGALRRNIKSCKPNALLYVDADLLSLWHVSFPRDELENELHNFNATPETELQPMDILLEIFDTPPTPKHVHIIVIINPPLLSVSDVLRLRPPSLDYINKVTRGGATTAANPRTPQSVVPWDGFEQNVNNDTYDTVPRYPRPTFTSYSRVCGETTVQAALISNVWEVLNVVLPQESFNSYLAIPSIVGQPDFIQLDSNEALRLVIEVKTKWVLATDDLVTTYAQNIAALQNKVAPAINVYNPIRQIFGYLSHNRLQYGALTTYDQTWFWFRPTENPSLLRVSSPIRFDNQNPTLFQCFFYLARLARNNHHCPSAPPTPILSSPLSSLSSPLSPSDHDGDDSFNGGSNRKGKGRGRGAGGRSPKKRKTSKKASGSGRTATHAHHPRDAVEFFDWDSFDVLDVLGTGRSGTVFKASLRGCIVALKVCDLWQHPEYEQELLNEIAMYHTLKTLQGKCIPMFKGAGYTAGGLFVVATEIVGRPLEDTDHLNDQERLVIRTALSSIHDLGVLHNDISKGNILIKRDGHRFTGHLVDFALSRQGCEREFQRETIFLDNLLRWS